MELYSKSDMIRYYRKKAGMTQEQLSEGICTPETLNRYENKSLVPSDAKYEQIMRRLGLNDTIVKFDVQTSVVEFHRIKKVILHLFEQGNFEKLDKIISRIKEKDYLSMAYIENQQFLGRIENIIKYQNQKMESDTYIGNLEQLLRLSFPEYSSKRYEPKEIYSEIEYLLINNIATAYGKNGGSETAYRLFSKTAQVLLKRRHRKCNTEHLLLINYTNFLGMQKKYDESMALCQKAIQWLKQNNNASYLFNFYYNIGWNIIEKAKATKDFEDIKIGRLYIWEAYQLSLIFKENKIAVQMIAEYYHGIDEIVP